MAIAARIKPQANTNQLSMIRKLLLLLPLAGVMFVQQQAKAQTDSLPPSWTFKGLASVTFSHVSYTNWVAGGENAIALNSNADLSANYAKGKHAWDNNLKLGYGIAWQESVKRTQKTLDVIDFSSKYGRKATDRWYYTALLGFKTQFSKGYASPTDSMKSSDFMAPAYLTFSLGMDYKHNGFSLFISPLSSKLTILNDSYLSSRGMYGVDTGAFVRKELFAGMMKLGYEKDFWEERMHLKTTLELFSYYMDNPQNIDVDWNFLLDFKIAKGFSAQLMLRAIYDDDAKITVTDDLGNSRQVAKLQFREFVGIGLAYSFDSSQRKKKE